MMNELEKIEQDARMLKEQLFQEEIAPLVEQLSKKCCDAGFPHLIQVQSDPSAANSCNIMRFNHCKQRDVASVVKMETYFAAYVRDMLLKDN